MYLKKRNIYEGANFRYNDTGGMFWATLTFCYVDLYFKQLHHIQDWTFLQEIFLHRASEEMPCKDLVWKQTTQRQRQI